MVSTCMPVILALCTPPAILNNFFRVPAPLTHLCATFRAYYMYPTFYTTPRGNERSRPVCCRYTHVHVEQRISSYPQFVCTSGLGKTHSIQHMGGECLHNWGSWSEKLACALLKAGVMILLSS